MTSKSQWPSKRPCAEWDHKRRKYVTVAPATGDKLIKKHMKNESGKALGDSKHKPHEANPHRRWEKRTDPRLVPPVVVVVMVMARRRRGMGSEARSEVFLSQRPFFGLQSTRGHCQGAQD